VILGLLAVFIYGGTQWGLISWLATYLEQVRNFSPFWASVAVSTVWGAEMVSRYIYGRLQMQCSERVLVLGTTGVGVPALLAALALPSVPLVLTALALGSLALGPLWPALIAHIGQVEDEYLATATGLAMTCASSGTIVAPILIGVVATQVGLSEAAYITVLALALLIPLFLPE
jgi:fucose permease